MKSVALLAASLLTAALSLTHASAQTADTEGGAAQTGSALYAKGEAPAPYKKLLSLNSPLATSLFRFIHKDKMLAARR